ncbi:hypothetical protein F5B20DRAFT_597133 [Whalleya microplaca]|nr:hypothetical protein F5B20DRAFT_597133 [Whalleya microplaca]
MYFSVAAYLTLAVALSAAASSDEAIVSIEVNETTTARIEARDYFDCKGSGLCSSFILGSCDDAANRKLIRNDNINYGAPGSGQSQTGACSGQCGVFIQGDRSCVRSGNQIWNDYHDIRGNGCKICGSKHWGAGCLTTINYVSGC